MKDKDVYIKILEFGINRTGGFTYDEIINAKELKKLEEWEKKIIDKYLLCAFRNKQHIDQMKSADYETMFFIIEGGGGNYNDIATKYTLSLDSRFKYIDYIELKEAREMSRQANKNANRALWFAVVTIVVSIFLTLWQIYSPIEIKGTQIDSIINVINKN